MHRDQIGERAGIAYFLGALGFCEGRAAAALGSSTRQIFFSDCGRRRPDWIRGASWPSKRHGNGPYARVGGTSMVWPGVVKKPMRRGARHPR